MNHGTVAIIAHDAGGAEILSSWLKRANLPFRLVLEGPAIKVFERKQVKGPLTGLDDAISICDWVLCGTSWQSNLEKRALQLAKQSNKKTVVFLDHWVNYTNRFKHNDAFLMPDEIWVGDKYAKKIAEELFPCQPIHLVENPYFLDLQENFSLLPKQTPPSTNVLYVCEPIKEHALLVYGDERYWGYTEEEALVFFLNHLSLFGKNIDRVTIRAHPSEPPNKYDWATLHASVPITISQSRTLEEDITQCAVVAGCSSMALVVGLIAGKRVISTIPHGGPPCELPHEKIEHLRNMTSRG